MTHRLDALRVRLDETGRDAFFSISPPDNQYLTGFLTSFGEISSGIIVTSREAIFLTDSRYTEQAREEVQGFSVEQISGDLLAACGERLTALGAKEVAYDPGRITVDERDRLVAKFKGQLEPVPTLVTGLRVRKSAEEIAAIRAASELAEAVLAELLPSLHPGLLEQELSAMFEFAFKKRGASGASFDTLALFGSRSSLPHGVPGQRALDKGDIVLLDFGCRRAGYCSDLTRTYAFGTIIDRWFETVYAVVNDAQRAALEAIKPGASCRDVDAVARARIKDAGYGEYFGHGLGHGVGVEIHEAPRLSPRSDAVLEEGMVVTVEPGIYVPGRGGVRIEDLVVVTRDGCDVITRTSKEFTVLGP